MTQLNMPFCRQTCTPTALFHANLQKSIIVRERRDILMFWSYSIAFKPSYRSFLHRGRIQSARWPSMYTMIRANSWDYGTYHTVGMHGGIWSSETSVTRFWSSPYGTLVVRHCIHNWRNTLLQNLDQDLNTSRLHVRIYSVSRFRACYLHRYVV